MTTMATTIEQDPAFGQASWLNSNFGSDADMAGDATAEAPLTPYYHIPSAGSTCSPFDHESSFNSPIDADFTMFDHQMYNPGNASSSAPYLLPNHASRLLTRPRRSVSEPPSGPTYPPRPPPVTPSAAPAMIFHRDDLYLGAPLSANPSSSPSLPPTPRRLYLKRAGPAKARAPTTRRQPRRSATKRKLVGGGNGDHTADDTEEGDEDEEVRAPSKRTRRSGRGPTSEAAAWTEEAVAVPLSVEGLRGMIDDAVGRALGMARSRGLCTYG